MPVAQSCPGVFAVNISIFIGYKQKGVWGAFLSTLGACLPSFIIILLIAFAFMQFRDNPWVEKFFKGLRPAVVALIAAPVFRMAKSSHINRYNVWIPVMAALAIWLMGVSPIYIILIAGLGGYASALDDNGTVYGYCGHQSEYAWPYRYQQCHICRIYSYGECRVRSSLGYSGQFYCHLCRCLSQLCSYAYHQQVPDEVQKPQCSREHLPRSASCRSRSSGSCCPVAHERGKLWQHLRNTLAVLDKHRDFLLRHDSPPRLQNKPHTYYSVMRNNRNAPVLITEAFHNIYL